MYKQKFTLGGLFGANLFVIGPIVSAIGLYILVRGPSAGDPGFGLLLLVAGGLASSIAVPMMLIGREYIQTQNFRWGLEVVHETETPPQRHDPSVSRLPSPSRPVRRQFPG